MVSLILDTDIWISFIAKDKPSGILDKIKTKIDDSEIVLLTNDIIIDEWNRNKEKTLTVLRILLKDLSIILKRHLNYTRKKKVKGLSN